MSPASTFITDFGPNSGYVGELFERFLVDPSLVGENWQRYFEALSANGGATNGAGTNGFGTNGTAATSATPSAAHRGASTGSAFTGSASTGSSTNANGADAAVSAAALTGALKVQSLVEAYRATGHLVASINPLHDGIVPLPTPPELAVEFYEFTEAELALRFAAPPFVSSPSTVEEIVKGLRTRYCGSVGYEYTHLLPIEEKSWMREQIEARFASEVPTTDAAFATSLLKKLVNAELFESELHRKYVGTKRFSLEGGETLIPMLETVCDRGAELGLKEVIIGMAHRGRLNVLANTLGKPLEVIFSEFEDRSVSSIVGAGDVKYHLGYRSRRLTFSGKEVELALAPNPSHLEFVNPVVLGMVRAHQDRLYGGDRRAACPVLIHGDAAFAGQGVVFETINMANVPGYTSGGTIHIVINNQIGFTTTPDEARSSAYCSDLAKGVGAPVFHVNGEDVEACCWAIACATEFRQKYGKDVIIDLMCYRKYGHNEGDDPSFTQPVTYAEIKNKKPVYQIYGAELEARGVLESSALQGLVKEYKADFEACQLRKIEISPDASPMHGRLHQAPIKTAVGVDVLSRVAATIRNYPEGFVPHPKLDKLLEKRVDTLRDGKGIEWGFAEGLAFGTLALDGVKVRLSGQDCCRGTFSQRHIVLDNYKGGVPYSPLSTLDGEGSFEVYNSPLSEISVMGFEFGYSAETPRSIVLWEGQFGDFANGAQVIIDQFICSSEAKWQQLSGIVLLLPHAYEGQGPEHSSARLERFLQLCAEGNMHVCYPTTAAQHFHLLRRQGLSEIRRPLIVMTPKSLLRLPQASSLTTELSEGAFSPILETNLGGATNTVVFLSGKVYYDVIGALEKAKAKGVRVVRVEQLYPLPEGEIRELMADIKPKKSIWLQEEPQNMGGWSFMHEQFLRRFEVRLEYVGRDPSGSTAAGSSRRHAVEQTAFLERLLELVG